MKRTYALAATLAAGLMFTTVPASAAAHRADERAVFTLSQLSGPRVGKLFVGYAVVAVKDLGNTEKVKRATKAVSVRLPFSKGFRVKPDACAIVAVAEGRKGARLRLNVVVGGAVQSSERGKAPNGVYCNV
ncbi:hypothetical protein [Streptosporangium carneum]|uniref:Uncharacterized protein n=1 Tax=Streptosporangium carneum TaxID=47481 RepID=A0A9W6I724_9ACTN|nr:hypothetical protein [Streptosporangium carneum]GLK12140.1 hypothetical protein GCM10017600_55480 [Streptosporangium carneum]